MKNTLFVLLFLFLILFSPVLFSQSVALDWVLSIGAEGGVHEGRKIVKDKDGYIYSVGNYFKTTDFDPGTGEFLLMSGMGNIYILKLTASGKFIKAQKISNSGNVRDPSIAIDNSGNLYVTGSFEYTVDFDLSSAFVLKKSNGKRDVFVVKLDSNWNYLWVKTFGSTQEDYVSNIILDNNGNVVVTGNYNGGMDIDPSDSSSYNLNYRGNEDAFILKLNPSGDFLWASSIGGSGRDNSGSLAADNENNIYITGFYENTVDFDPGSAISNLSSYGESDIFIQKLDSLGRLKWVKSFGGIKGDAGWNIIFKESHIYILGRFQDTIFFENHKLSAANKNNTFFLKMNTLGEVKLVNSFVSSGGSMAATSMSYDSNNNFFISGYYWNKATFLSSDSIPEDILSQNYYDAYIVKIDSFGICSWVKTFGGMDYDAAYSICVMDNDKLLLTGFFGKQVDFNFNRGVDTLKAIGDKDIFIMQLNLCESSSNNIDTISCGPFKWNNVYLTQSGTYYDTLNNYKGCDSFITINLSVISVNLDITSKDSKLTSNETDATYQWLDCKNNYSFIVGEKSQFFVAKESGNYSVQITKNECVDTSICISILLSGVDNLNSVKTEIFPNPATNYLQFSLSDQFKDADVLIVDDFGRICFNERIKQSSRIELSQFNAGLYYVRVQLDSTNFFVKKIIILK